MKRVRLACLALSLLAVAGAAHAEAYIGLLGGNNGTVSAATVSATQTQFICFAPPCSQTVSGPVRFNREHTAGIRTGAWYDWFGVAWEYTSSGATSASGPGTAPGNSVEVNFDALSVLLMGRTPALESRYFPDSYLYAGFGISSVYGRVSVSAPPLAPVSGTTTTTGVLFLAGGTLRFSRHAMLFAEWRGQQLSFDYSGFNKSANIPFDVSEFVLGVAYWY